MMLKGTADENNIGAPKIRDNYGAINHNISLY